MGNAISGYHRPGMAVRGPNRCVRMPAGTPAVPIIGVQLMLGWVGSALGTSTELGPPVTNVQARPIAENFPTGQLECRDLSGGPNPLPSHRQSEPCIL